MMNIDEITKLRKSGRLNDAYYAAQKCLQGEPDNIWAKRAMAWILYDFVKQNTSLARQVQFIRCMRQIALLQLPETEEMFYNCIGIVIRCAVRKCVDAGSSCDDFLDELFNIIKRFPVRCPGETYSGWLQTFIKTKLCWKHFDSFVEWWNLQNLRAEDFEPTTLPNGNRDFSLGEKALMSYSKFILTRIPIDEDQIRNWLPVLERMKNDHPQYIYLPYYQARLLMAIGEGLSAADVLRPFVKKKSGEFWVWELLGDAEANTEKQFAFYCKAMLCKNKDEMLVALREKVILGLVERKMFAEAKFEILKVQYTREVHKWRLSENMQKWLNADWFGNATPVRGNDEYYLRVSELLNGEWGVCKKEKVEKMKFAGELKKCGINYGFVGEVFIPLILAETVNNGDMVRGIAVKSFDKKKRQWGWKAIKLYR